MEEKRQKKWENGAKNKVGKEGGRIMKEKKREKKKKQMKKKRKK